MRIIGGKYRGKQIRAPKGLPVRPTTDQAKESLFNILTNRLDFRELRVLDGFAGTGNVSYEFLSRGAEFLMAVDRDFKCHRFVRGNLSEWFPEGNWQVQKRDFQTWLKNPSGGPYDLIFLDPPYAMPGQKEMVATCMEGELLAADGLLILEHLSGKDFSEMPTFTELRKYGSSSFSFFQKDL